jgi:hypothetical protein
VSRLLRALVALGALAAALFAPVAALPAASAHPPAVAAATDDGVTRTESWPGPATLSA